MKVKRMKKKQMLVENIDPSVCSSSNKLLSEAEVAMGVVWLVDFAAGETVQTCKM